MNSGYVYAALCVISWSFIPVVSRLGQVDLDNFQLLFWSNILSLIVLSLAFTFSQGLSFRGASIRAVPYVLFLGSLGCSIYYLFLYYGYANGNSIEVLLIQYSWPLQMVLLANLILKEALSFKKFLILIAGFFGIVIIITKGRIFDVQFSGLEVGITVLIGAFCFALFSVLSKRSNMDVFLFTMVLFTGGAVTSIFALFLFSEFQWPNRQELIPVFANGIFINGFSYLLWIFALRKISVTAAGIMIFLTPLFSIIWLIMFFEEVLYSSHILGGCIVILSSFYLLRERNSS
mgnify:FL=1